ncbi:MAG: hypothetical protein EBT39_01895 [Sphingobacteriia bacterium]|jgi:hypothetical protein|nr:hypothetical protein [Candidatus Fonsibacter lacus]
MIIQLPNGRIIECSIEQYLSLSDDEVRDLNGLSAGYTKEVSNPFYNSFSKPVTIPLYIDDDSFEEFIDELIIEHEPELYEIEDDEKREDPDFHPDDI